MYLLWILLDIIIFIFRLNLFQIDIILSSLQLGFIARMYICMLRILNITGQVFFLTG